MKNFLKTFVLGQIFLKYFVLGQKFLSHGLKMKIFIIGHFLVGQKFL